MRMSGINLVIINGRLGKDPELKQITDKLSVCNFTVATSDKWVDKEGYKQEKTEWHNIVVWGNQAKSCGQFLKKGSLVTVEGKISTRSYDDKNGVKKYTTEIKANNVEFDSKANGNKQTTEQPSFNSGDVPF